jgi:DNA replication protein DnaC
MDAKLVSIAKSIICNACGDDRHEQTMRQSEAIRILRRNEHIEALIPPEFQDTIPGRLPNQKSHTKAMAWEYEPRGLVLHGATRTGKTRTAWLILKRECIAGRVVTGINHTSFARECMSHSSAREAQQWVEILMHADLLLLDDLGKARFTNVDGIPLKAEDCLWDLLEYRWNNKLPTIFTTNHAGDTLRDRLNPDKADAFIARLREFQSAIHF